MSASDTKQPPGPPIDAPGWEAIDIWVGSRYPGQVPHQYSSSTAYDLGSASPLPAITVWESKESWHFVSYGLSELFEKSSPKPGVSGFGFELSFRLRRDADEAQPPVWALRLLQAIGGSVLRNKQGIDSGHCINIGGPIVPPGTGVQSELTGFVCIPDVRLGKMEEGPFGSVLFLQLVGLDAEELALFREYELRAVVDALAELSFEGVTDPERASWASDPQKSKILRRFKVGLKL
jgi:hypothetical protein